MFKAMIREPRTGALQERRVKRIGVAERAPTRYPAMMDFDYLLVRFFGTADIDTLVPDRLAEGVERLRLQFGLERDSGRRFALWCLMYMLGVAPDLGVAFKDEDDRDAARDFMDEADRLIEEDDEEQTESPGHSSSR